MKQEFPLITIKKKGSSIREIDFPSWGADTIPKPILVNRSLLVSEGMTEARSLAAKGNIVLWVENTVGEAQEVYENFLKGGANLSLGILHSRFLSQHRHNKEQTWVNRLGKGGNRSSGAILVSTQVCEQSLDIDADALFTNLCPTDMLLQRVGRMWRHRQNDQLRKVPYPVIHLRTVPDSLLLEANSLTGVKKDMIEVQKKWGKTSYVYDLYTLCRAAAVWGNIDSITLPNDLRALLDLTYGSNPTVLPFSALKVLMDNECQRLQSLTRVNLNTGALFSAAPHISLSDEERGPGTRDITDGTVKACLLSSPGVTLLGKPVGYPSGNRAETKRDIILSSLSLPAKSVKLLGTSLLQGDDPKGIKGDKYTRSVLMKKVGGSWVPLDALSGKVIPDMYYNENKGWLQ
jgi:hypothetical protein